MGCKLAALAATWLLFAAAPTHELLAAHSSPDASVVKEVLALERARNEAIQKGDVAAIAAMTSDHYTFITIRGELQTKSEIVKRFATGSFKYDWRQISDLKARINGDTAIVTGRASQEGVENQKDYSGAYEFTRVYVRQKGSWKTVALQTTLEAPN